MTKINIKVIALVEQGFYKGTEQVYLGLSYRLLVHNIVSQNTNIVELV